MPKIIAYRGLSNADTLVVHGRVFHRYGLRDPHPGHGLWRNIREAYKRYSLEVLPQAPVEIRCNNRTYEAVTDEAGFFRCHIEAEGFPQDGWHAYNYRLPGDDTWGTGEFLSASGEATGVISDIDDTVLVSYSTHALRKFSLIVARNAYSRRPFPFIKNWYARLQELNDGTIPADYFYVSDSEWNLYDFLVDFFSIHGLPKGPFLLKELRQGLPELLFGSQGRKRTPKFERIRFLMEFFPEKPFILVGDSGQQDMDIYSRVVLTWPGRVKAVLIRDLPLRDEEKIAKTRELFLKVDVPFHAFSE